VVALLDAAGEGDGVLRVPRRRGGGQRR